MFHYPVCSISMAHVYPTGSGSSLGERLATMKTYFAFREAVTKRRALARDIPARAKADQIGYRFDIKHE